MKQTAFIALTAFAMAGFGSAQACEYMNKTMTLKTGKDTQQVTQTQAPVQSPIQADQQDKLLADVKKPVSDAN